MSLSDGWDPSRGEVFFRRNQIFVSSARVRGCSVRARRQLRVCTQRRVRCRWGSRMKAPPDSPPLPEDEPTEFRTTAQPSVIAAPPDTAFATDDELNGFASEGAIEMTADEVRARLIELGVRPCDAAPDRAVQPSPRDTIIAGAAQIGKAPACCEKSHMPTPAAGSQLPDGLALYWVEVGYRTKLERDDDIDEPNWKRDDYERLAMTARLRTTPTKLYITCTGRRNSRKNTIDATGYIASGATSYLPSPTFYRSMSGAWRRGAAIATWRNTRRSPT